MTEKNNRQIRFWLFGCAALVFAMVVLGGVTRLTGSGLSMVDWRPVTGVLPPLSSEQWNETFEMYKASPEYAHYNHWMSLEDFKGIFWLEYLHRLLGRLIGVVFLVPFLWFVWKGAIGKREIPKYLGIFALGGLQGLMGWYMVKSGLVDVPHVSQYRLTAHLLVALAIWAFILWLAYGLTSGSASSKPPTGSRRGALAVLLLTTATIAAGGLVAGLKAGYAYPTFPKMDGHWIPPGALAMDPWWSNFFANIALVQFNHRVLALLTLGAVVAYAVWTLRVRRSEPGRWIVLAMAGTAVLQVTLGITTLLARVPVGLATAHQGVAFILFAFALLEYRRLKPLHRPVRSTDPLIANA